MDRSNLDAPFRSRRRSLRRSLRAEAEVTSELWDGSVHLLATDLSLEGLWLESDLPLELGSEVSLSLVLPRRAVTQPFQARARVAHVSLSRRRTDHGRRAGMGLCFLELSVDHRERLAHALIALPPVQA